MRRHIVVCPGDAPYLERLKGFTCVFTVGSVLEADRVITDAKQIGINVHAVAIHSRIPLGIIELHEEWGRTPIALFVPAMGMFKDMVRQLGRLRTLNIRVYLAVDREENLKALRILASLGIPCAAEFGEGRIDWDAMTDLATHALLGLSPHGTIEPFEEMARQYRQTGRTEFRGVYFEDPTRFVHADEHGKLAFSSKDLGARYCFSEELSNLDTLTELPAYQQHLNAWRSVFKDFNTCSICAGWRICGGYVQNRVDDNPGCKAFAEEVMGLVERRAELRRNVEGVWQV